ncbi:coilin [Chelmon rostratus]|uniref:coilin n=1 Tax=Chelmon rostratus TaxID=109905 RepID=UPI001BECF8E7|nr:coilin [Chelmon rostratus]
MAAHSNNFIRVRLYFDYPPPAVIDCRMCWLLVNLNTCRVVADLESIIREKFEFSRRSVLSLFVEDCYLPHTESIYVVRDNDSVRVKVDFLAQVNANSSDPDGPTASGKCRKRQRPAEDNGPGENGVNVEWVKKKRKKGSEKSLERDAKQASGDERSKKSQKKRKEKKKRKKAEGNGPAVTPKTSASTKKTPARADQPGQSNKKPPAVQARAQDASSSDSSSSSSEEDAAPKKTAAQKPAPNTPSSTPAAAKAPPATKPTQAKPHPPSSSSSESDSSSDEATSVKTLPKNKPVTSTTPKAIISDSPKPPQDKVAEPCTSSSEEEIKLVIRQPAQQPGRGVGGQSPWRGRGRGRPRRGGPGERGRGEGRGGMRGHTGSFELSYNGAKEPAYQTDSLTNTSVVLQNGAESAPKQDYSSMPLLAAPPQVGQKIAFKLLELTESYTPEVSEYKEGRIVSFDHATKQIELELQHVSQAPVEPGKFDLVYQNPDGSERVEYAVSRGSRVTERWDSLLEPRLII